jgi:ankyrin repeat protein
MNACDNDNSILETLNNPYYTDNIDNIGSVDVDDDNNDFEMILNNDQPYSNNDQPYSNNDIFNTLMILAIQINDNNTVTSLLDNSSNQYDLDTIFLECIINDNLIFCKKILNKVNNISNFLLKVDSNGYSYLIYSVIYGCLNISRFLIETEPKLIYCLDKNHSNFLYYINYNLNIHNIFQKYKELLFHKNIFGDTIVHHNIKNNNVTIVKYFCSYKEYKDLFFTKDSYGNTLIHLLFIHNVNNIYKSELNILIKHYSEIINVKNNEEETILHLACKFNYIDIIELIVDIDKDIVSSQDKYGNTCLHHAIKSNSIESSKYLIDNNPSLLYINSKINSSPVYYTINIQNSHVIFDYIISQNSNFLYDKIYKEYRVLDLVIILNNNCLFEYFINNTPYYIYENYIRLGYPLHKLLHYNKYDYAKFMIHNLHTFDILSIIHTNGKTCWDYLENFIELKTYLIEKMKH